MENKEITKIIEDKEGEVVLLKKSFLGEEALGLFMQTHHLKENDPIVQKNKEVGEEITRLEKELEVLREAVGIIESTNSQNIQKAAQAQKELLENLAARVRDGKINTTVDRQDITISQTLFTLNKKTGWETEKLEIGYTNIEDTTTYKVKEYYYDYDSTSEPPTVSRPTITNIDKEEALEKFFSLIKKLSLV